jgi:hypothetical protein
MPGIWGRKVVNKNVAQRSGPSAIPAPRRKISRSEWSAIGARYATGESLASIARAYRCTAPAIRYILNTERRLSGFDDAQAQQENQASTAGVALTEHGVVDSSSLASGDAGSLIDAQALANRAFVQSGGKRTVGFDMNLKEGMTLEISKFLVAFDAIFAGATPQAFDRLREATDRLMRAAARVRIELERGLVHPRLD